MEKIVIIPRSRLENESLEEYKAYLKDIYFESDKPCPQSRYDFAYSQNLPDTYEIMDGENGKYTKYLEKYYQKYYKNLNKKVNKAVRKCEKNNSKMNKFICKIYNKVGKLKEFKLSENSKIKNVMAKLSKLEINENLFRKMVNMSFYSTLFITAISFVTFFFMKNAMGLIIGTIGILASKTLAPERKTKEEKQAKKIKTERNKSKISFRKIKDGLVNVFTKKKTTSESNFTSQDEVSKYVDTVGFDTTVEENINKEDLSFDVTADEIEIIKDAEEIHLEPETVFNPEIIKEESEIEFDTSATEQEQEFSFDSSVPEYKLNEGQPGELEVASLDIPKTDTKLSVYIPNFFKEKISKLNSNKHVKVMKK